MYITIIVRELTIHCRMETEPSDIQYKCKNLNKWGWDAPCEKSWKQGNSLSNTGTTTIMRNTSLHIQAKGYT